MLRTHHARGDGQSAAPSLVRVVLTSLLSLSLLWVAAPLLARQKRDVKSQTMLQKQIFSRRHLKTLHLGIIQYMNDNDGRMPALDSTQKLGKQLKRYQIPAATLICPFTNKPYSLNKQLAGKRQATIASPSNTLLAWSSYAMPGRRYLVLDAGGLDRIVSAAQFARTRRAGGG